MDQANKTMQETAAPMARTVKSDGDDRVANNVMRHEYRVLNDAEKEQMRQIKDLGLQMDDLLAAVGTSREISLARTKNEESVMWGVKHITK